MAEGGDSQLKNAVRGGDGLVTGVDERGCARASSLLEEMERGRKGGW
jgi:hypothetical protein